jgi:nucleoside phosphorylase/tetratricopeptide (TPR) repeat protein
MTTNLPSIPPEVLDRYRPKKDVSAHLSIVNVPPNVNIALLILTVKEPELLAVFELLEPFPDQTKILGYLSEYWMYYFGRFGPYNTVLLASHTAGIEAALHSLGDAIRQWHPRLVINVGIAWGADPSTQKLGDVLVAQKVVNTDNIRHEMSNIVESSPIPEIDTRSLSTIETCKLLWNFNNVHDQKCQVHTGLYLGSNSLLNSPDRKKKFLQRHQRAIGGEMESYAVYAAAARSKIPWMVIKGISDWGDGTKSPNKDYHGVATASAASFVHKMCTAIPNLVEHSMNASDEKDVPSNTGRKYNNLRSIVKYFKMARLRELESKINIRKRETWSWILCAITGLAGCGKSELAEAYASQSLEDLSIFRWRLDPDPDGTNNNATQVSYRQAFSALLYNFGIQSIQCYENETPEQIHQRVLDLVWKRINQYSQWIVIFDNAGSYADIVKYLPHKKNKSRGEILVTSQRSNFLADEIGVNFQLSQGLDPSEAIELLKDISNRHTEDQSIAMQLATQLDFSPLGIRIAGGYIRTVDDLSFDGYTHLLNKSIHEEFIDIIGGSTFITQLTHNDKQNRTLQATVQISIQKVSERNPKLFRILQYSGFLANENIPIDLITGLFQNSSTSKEYIENELKTLIIGKDNYSLLTYDIKNRTLRVHRTTQFIMRALVPSSMEIIGEIVDVMLELYPYDQYSVQRNKICKTMQPHFIALLRFLDSNQTMNVYQLQLQFLLGRLAFAFSEYLQAFEYLDNAWNLALAMNVCVKMQCQILLYRGATRRFLSQMSESRLDLEQALKMGQNTYNQADWHLAQIYNHLAYTIRWHYITFTDCGLSPEQFLQYHQNAREICENSRSACKGSKIELAFSYWGIGHYYRSIETFNQAITLYNQALEIYTTYDNRYPDIAGVYQSLARLGFAKDQENFVNVGVDYPTSLKYVNESLNRYREAFGSMAFEVAEIYYLRSRLLYVSATSADREKALQDQNQAIIIREHILGPASRELIEPYYWKARILENSHQDDEAIRAYEHSRSICQKDYNRQVDWIDKIDQRLRKLKTRLSFAKL